MIAAGRPRSPWLDLSPEQLAHVGRERTRVDREFRRLEAERIRLARRWAVEMGWLREEVV